VGTGGEEQGGFELHVYNSSVAFKSRNGNLQLDIRMVGIRSHKFSCSTSTFSELGVRLDLQN